MRQCTPILNVSLAAAMACTGGFSQSKVTTVDLRPYGAMTYNELHAQYPVLGQKGYVTYGPPIRIAEGGRGFVAIDSSGRIYAGLPLWTSPPAHVNKTRGAGDKLRVLLVGTGGKVERVTDYPANSLARLKMDLAEDGTLLVYAQDKLMRIGQDGKSMAELALPPETKDGEYWDMTASTTGRTLRFRLSESHALTVNPNTLSVVSQCPGITWQDDGGEMTDKLQFSSTRVQAGPNEYSRQLQIQEFCGKREQLGQFKNINFESVVVNDTELMAIQERAFSLRTMDGEQLWTSPSPKGLVFDLERPRHVLSRDGGRVAFEVVRKQQYHLDSMDPVEIRNGTWNHLVTDSYPQAIGVWDVASGKAAAVVPLDGQTFTESTAEFALSPDGRMLAVLQDGVLNVWKLD